MQEFGLVVLVLRAVRTVTSTAHNWMLYGQGQAETAICMAKRPVHGPLLQHNLATQQVSSTTGQVVKVRRIKSSGRLLQV
jgi:hypothetical protein